MPNHVFQLSHISWPVVAAQRNLRPLRETVDLLVVLLRELFYKVPRQNRQIAYALRELWRLDLNHGEPDKQVFTKLAVGNLLAQIFVGGRHYAYIHFLRR